MNQIPSALSLGIRRGGLEIRQFARQRESVVFTLLFPTHANTPNRQALGGYA